MAAEFSRALIEKAVDQPKIAWMYNFLTAIHVVEDVDIRSTFGTFLGITTRKLFKLVKS